MTFRPRLVASTLALLAVSACATKGGDPSVRSETTPVAQAAAPLEPPLELPAPTRSDGAPDGVRSVIVPGRGGAVLPSKSVTLSPRAGDVALNFPRADVAAVAKVVLGDLLKLTYVVAPDVNAQITLVTPRPIARADILPVFEESLRPAGLALVNENGVYNILPSAQAKGAAPGVTQGVTGYGSETLTLRFVSPAELVRVIDKVMPGVVAAVPDRPAEVVISGTSGQRRGARDLIAQFDVNWLKSMSFGLFVPAHTDSRLIVPELDKVLNDAAAPSKGLVRLIAMDRLNGILAVSTQSQYLDDVRRWVEILDREGQSTERRLFVYHVQNGRSSDLAKTLNDTFGTGGGDSDKPTNGASSGGKSPGVPSTAPTLPRLDLPGAVGEDSSGSIRINSDDTNNSVIAFATPREYAIVESALRQLDTLPLQVMLEAAITEVTLTDKLRYGVQWQFQVGDLNGAQTLGGTAAPTRIFPGVSLLYSNNDSISATLNALENLTKINVVSAPKLLVLNNQTASLQVGDQVPVSTATSVSTQSANSPVINSIEYRDTGVILKVTPRVNDSGLVLLDIAQEVSSVAPTSTSNIDSPTISTRRIASSVAVRDGQIIALGGLITEGTTKGKNGVPVLSRIPVLGSLFGTHSNDKTRTELLVLLKPRVIRSAEDGAAITADLRAKLHALRPNAGTSDLP